MCLEWRGARLARFPRLLLLRVFALGRRSESLYDSLGKSWRAVGSMQLIAGPDLATSTIEPHEFLDFVSGRLDRRFIDTGGSLDLRIDQMDLAPDRRLVSRDGIFLSRRYLETHFGEVGR